MGRRVVQPGAGGITAVVATVEAAQQRNVRAVSNIIARYRINRIYRKIKTKV